MSNTATQKQIITVYHCTGCGLEHSLKEDSSDTAATIRQHGFVARHNSQGVKSYVKLLNVRMCDSCNPHYFN